MRRLLYIVFILVLLPVPHARLLWRVPLPGAPVGAPVAAASMNLVFAATAKSLGGELYALDPRTGAFRWTIPRGSRDLLRGLAVGELPGVGPTLAAVEGDHRIRALDATGRTRWNWSTADRIDSRPVFGTLLHPSNPAVFATSSSRLTGTLAAISARDGRTLWERTGQGSERFGSNLVLAGPRERRLAVAAHDSEAFTFDAATGWPRGRIPLAGLTMGHALIPDLTGPGSDLVLAIGNGRARAFDTAAGRVVWAFDDQWVNSHVLFVAAPDRLMVLTLIEGHTHFSICAVDPATGTIRYRRKLPQTLQESIRIAAGDIDGDGRPELIFTTWDWRSGTILVMDAATGATRTVIPAGNEELISPVLADLDGDGRAELLAWYETEHARGLVAFQIGL
jgi:outer membrane protein assembly factor BamB